MRNIEEIASEVVDAAFHLHRNLGPGLLESVYEAVLARMLERRGLHVLREESIAFDFDEMHFEHGLRVDLLVDGKLIVELKAVETLMPLHSRQLLTYLRLLELPLGLLINFGGASFGVRRIVNNHRELTSSRLRVNQSDV